MFLLFEVRLFFPKGLCPALRYSGASCSDAKSTLFHVFNAFTAT
jgi:hypothetical protein